jgi:hypothetical protein
VKGNTFVSPTNPAIHVTVDESLTYLGSLPFTIDQAAAGHRFVFVRATPDRYIERMFIIQQEGFLPSSTDTYKYPITDPVKLGSSEYRHSVSIYDNDAGMREQPGKEGDLTKQFLTARGYMLEPGLVMARFARPADPAHKHEIIFFCYENLSAYGRTILDFPENSDSAEKRDIKRRVDENCHHTFRVSE